MNNNSDPIIIRNQAFRLPPPPVLGLPELLLDDDELLLEDELLDDDELLDEDELLADDDELLELDELPVRRLHR